MVSYESVINAIPEPQWKDKDIVDYQDTGDIIKDLIFCFKKYNDQAKGVAKKFSTGNITTDARRIHSFIKDNIQYEAEPEKFQTTRSFSRIIHDKHGDCKHSALIVSAIGWNLGYDVIFRFVGYNRGESYGHVYTLLQNPKTGKRVVVDPLQVFGEEKRFLKHKDYIAKNNLNFNPMLSRLTGLPENSNIQGMFMGDLDITETRIIDGIGGREIILSPTLHEDRMGEIEDIEGIGRKTKAQRKATKKVAKAKRAVKKTARKEKRAVKKEKRGGSIVKKVALAPVRGAFSALLLLNFRGFATRLQESKAKNENEVKKFAAKFGYKYPVLLSQIDKGAKKKPLFGKVSGMYQIEGIGSVAISAAAVAAAAPAILAVTNLFKALGVGAHKDSPVGEKSDNEIANEAANDIEGGSGGGSGSEGGSGGSWGGSGCEGGSGGSWGGSRREGGSGGSGGGSGREGGSGGSDDDDSGLMDTVKNLPTPVLVIGAAGLLFAAGKVFKLF